MSGVDVHAGAERLARALPWDAEPVTAIATATGRVLAASDPSRAPSLEAAALQVLDFFAGDWAPGDAALTNDAAGVTEFTLVGAGPGGVGIVRLRMPDIGGFQFGGLSPESFDGWGEGARFPALRIAVAGRARAQALDLVALNSRTPVLLRRALAAMEAQAAELAAAAEEHAGPLEAARGRAAEAAREALAALRPGTYRAEVAVESPVAGHAPVIRVVLDVGEAPRLDLSASDGRVDAPLNSTPAHTRDCCLDALAAALPGFPRWPGGLDRIALDPGADTLTGATAPAISGLAPYFTARAIRRAVTRALQAAGAPADRDADLWWTEVGAARFAAYVDPETLRMRAERVADLVTLERGGRPA